MHHNRRNLGIAMTIELHIAPLASMVHFLSLLLLLSIYFIVGI